MNAIIDSATKRWSVLEEASKRWSSLCARLGIAHSAADKAFNVLVKGYQGRGYHNLEHVLYVLDRVNELQQSGHPEAFELAAFWHDWDPIVSVSAVAARKWVVEALRSPALADTVFNLVLDTLHTAPSFMGDCDLAILGEDEDVYDDYVLRVMEEYPADKWVKGRIEFLRAMLARPSLFHTPAFRLKYQGRAYANMKRELWQLERS